MTVIHTLFCMYVKSQMHYVRRCIQCLILTFRLIREHLNQSYYPTIFISGWVKIQLRMKQVRSPNIYKYTRSDCISYERAGTAAYKTVELDDREYVLREIPSIQSTFTVAHNYQPACDQSQTWTVDPFSIARCKVSNLHDSYPTSLILYVSVVESLPDSTTSPSILPLVQKNSTG